MPTTQSIINKIDEAALGEEKALPIYTAHISATLFWSGLDKDVQKEIIGKLQILHDDSLHHVQILEKIKEIIKKKYV